MINQKNQKPQLSEGESNSSKRRAEWEEDTHNSETRKLLEQDASFLASSRAESHANLLGAKGKASSCKENAFFKSRCPYPM